MLKIVKFKDLVFEVSLDFSTLGINEKSYRAKAEFTDGTWVSVIYGYGTNAKGDTYEAFFSDEDDVRGYQTRTELDEEFYRRSFPFDKPELIWEKIK